MASTVAAACFPSPSARHGAMAGINITPLVDVLLVLLIIFMVAAPLLTRTLPLELPAYVPDPPPPPAEALELRISGEGMLLLGSEVVGPSQLGERLRRAAAARPQPALEISVAAQASYQQLTAVLAAARNAGIERIGIGEDGG